MVEDRKPEALLLSIFIGVVYYLCPSSSNVTLVGMEALPLWCMAETLASEADDVNLFIVAHSFRIGSLNLGYEMTEVVVGNLLKKNFPAALLRSFGWTRCTALESMCKHISLVW